MTKTVEEFRAEGCEHKNRRDRSMHNLRADYVEGLFWCEDCDRMVYLKPKNQGKHNA